MILPMPCRSFDGNLNAGGQFYRIRGPASTLPLFLQKFDGDRMTSTNFQFWTRLGQGIDLKARHIHYLQATHCLVDTKGRSTAAAQTFQLHAMKLDLAASALHHR